ncbi:MAG: hypothetical protein ACKPCM_01455 [Pseudanabaena sp.]
MESTQVTSYLDVKLLKGSSANFNPRLFCWLLSDRQNNLGCMCMADDKKVAVTTV